jgi:hypothetical protein
MSEPLMSELTAKVKRQKTRHWQQRAYQL